MTHESQRPSWLVIVPPPVWALAFIVAAWALGAPAVLQSTFGGLFVFVLGVGISGTGRFAFERAGTEVLPASKKNTALVTGGVYRFTRNPMYLGVLIAMLGLALVVGTVPAFVSVGVFVLFVNFISIPYEEEKMERQFGEDFRNYKRRVRRWV